MTAAIAREIKNYDELIEICNQRANELQLTRAELDELSQLQEGYSSKILRKKSVKTIGHVSMRLFGALGIRLFLLQNDDATARILAQRTPRKERHDVHHCDAERANV